MSEGAPSGGEPSLGGRRLDLDLEYETSDNLRWRQEVYRFASDPLDTNEGILDDILGRLQLNGTEIILDSGCAHASTLMNLYEGGHKGLLAGLDLYRHLFERTRRANQRHGISPISFIHGNIESLPLADDSVDVAFAERMFYHVENPLAGLDELQRVVRPGGKLVITTDGELNKEREKLILERMARLFDTTPPPSFVEPFDFSRARYLLYERFGAGNIDHRQHSGAIQIGPLKPGSEAAYERSILGKKEHFGRGIAMAEWEMVFASCVRPWMQQEINEHGFFTEQREYHSFICTNN